MKERLILTDEQMGDAAKRLEAGELDVQVTPAVSFHLRRVGYGMGGPAMSLPSDVLGVAILVRSEAGREMRQAVGWDGPPKPDSPIYAIEALTCWAGNQLMCSRERLATTTRT